jgi:hypothetical protein
VALKPFQTSDFVRSSNSYGDVRLTFGSEQAVNAVSPATPNASTTQYSGVVRNGGTYIYAQFKATDNLSSGQYAVELRTGYDCTNPSHIVMTTSVERKYQQGKPYPDAPVFFVNDTDYLYIEGWKAKELSDTLFTTRWKLELYEGSTLLGDDTFNMPNTGDFAVGNYQPCRFFCCPYYMSLSSAIRRYCRSSTIKLVCFQSVQLLHGRATNSFCVCQSFWGYRLYDHAGQVDEQSQYKEVRIHSHFRQLQHGNGQT